MRINLKVLRASKNFSQGQMADAIGCSRATYGSIEQGARVGGERFWIQLQQAFDIPDSDMWALRKNEE